MPDVLRIPRISCRISDDPHPHAATAPLQLDPSEIPNDHEFSEGSEFMAYGQRIPYGHSWRLFSNDYSLMTKLSKLRKCPQSSGKEHMHAACRVFHEFPYALTNVIHKALCRSAKVFPCRAACDSIRAPNAQTSFPSLQTCCMAISLPQTREESVAARASRRQFRGLRWRTSR